jgi:hypothetical protein
VSDLVPNFTRPGLDAHQKKHYYTIISSYHLTGQVFVPELVRKSLHIHSGAKFWVRHVDRFLGLGAVGVEKRFIL